MNNLAYLLFGILIGMFLGAVIFGLLLAGIAAAKAQKEAHRD